MIDAEITIKFVIEDICKDEDFDPECDSLEQRVIDLIEAEGLYTFTEDIGCDDFEIVDVKRI
jgi:hypothetical protein